LRAAEAVEFGSLNVIYSHPQSARQGFRPVARAGRAERLLSGHAGDEIAEFGVEIALESVLEESFGEFERSLERELICVGQSRLAVWAFGAIEGADEVEDQSARLARCSDKRQTRPLRQAADCGSIVRLTLAVTGEDTEFSCESRARERSQ
jgi:hypothetical protein